MIQLLSRRTPLFGVVLLSLLGVAPADGDTVDLELEYNANQLEWQLFAQVIPTGSGNNGEFGLAAVRALIDNVPAAGVHLADDIGAIDPIGLGGPNERKAVLTTLGGTVDIIYAQNLAAPATVVEGVGVGGRSLIAWGNYLDANLPPSFGDDDFGYVSDGNFLNRLGPSSYGPAFPWDGVILTVEDVTPLGIEGDYNDDGMVDVRDYVVWRNHLGAPAGSLPNDPHHAGIGISQYTTWKQNYGLSVPPGVLPSQLVPEPQTLALAIGAVLALVGWKSRVRDDPRAES